MIPMEVPTSPVVDLDDSEVAQFTKIIRSVFGLTKSQEKVFSKIRQCSSGGTCILNLVQLLNSERSIIQKYLSILMKKKLITRNQVTLGEFKDRCMQNNRNDLIKGTIKGYLYLYSPISDEKLINRIKKITSRWRTAIEAYCNSYPVMTDLNS
jgi:predicted transcriptional regulator